MTASIAQLVLFTLGLAMFAFGLFVGVHPEGDQTVGALLMFAGIAQAVYGLSTGNEQSRIKLNKLKTPFPFQRQSDRGFGIYSSRFPRAPADFPQERQINQGFFGQSSGDDRIENPVPVQKGKVLCGLFTIYKFARSRPVADEYALGDYGSTLG